jgi:hypothetical protein
MKLIKHLIMNTFLKVFIIFSGLLLLLALPSNACTIFTLTDSKLALFCNNEDWKDPNTRIWFIPAEQDSSSGKMKFGRAYVGFKNQWGQGGVNSKGLSYDWVAWIEEDWNRKSHPNLKSVRGNPAERMLESCATVDEAIAFFKLYWEPSFSHGIILISDHTGKSVLIGAKNDELEFNISMQSRGFGHGFIKDPKILGENPAPTLTNASKILKNSLQTGPYGTKYSNVFDLKTGDIFIYRFPHQTNPVKLNLSEELKKGAHYYDIPVIEEQLTKKPKSISRFKEWWKKYKIF